MIWAQNYARIFPWICLSVSIVGFYIIFYKKKYFNGMMMMKTKTFSKLFIFKAELFLFSQKTVCFIKKQAFFGYFSPFHSLVSQWGTLDIYEGYCDKFCLIKIYLDWFNHSLVLENWKIAFLNICTSAN